MNNLSTCDWPFSSRHPFTDVTSSAQASSSSADFISGVFELGRQSIPYKLYIPSAYCGQPLPLVVMLHGCGQTAADFALGTGMNEQAEIAECMVLYPEQSSQANWNRCWHWYEQAHHERDEGEPALIAGLTRNVMAQYAIDASRVSVAGLSSGGAMAVILGRTYPDIFQAVGCHSGLAHGSARDAWSAMAAMRNGADMPSPQYAAASNMAATMASLPIIVFHGDVDYTVNQKNSADVVRQAIDCYAVQQSGEFRETAMSEETGNTGGRRFTRHTHRGEAGDVVAEQWTVHGSGHAWSGGNREGSYADESGPDASKEMLRFFLKQ